MNDERRKFSVHPSSFIVLRSFIVLTVLILLGCSQPEPSNPVTTDDIGRPVALPSKITRIVTLAPNVTEMLFAIGAGERVVGTDDFSDEPARAKQIAKVGGMQPNIEKIAALKPDLVIATSNGNHPSLAPALAQIKVPLYVSRTDRLDEIPVAMKRLGAIVGVSGEAAAESLKRSLAGERRVRARKPRILFAVWPDPLYIAGRNTFTDDLFRLTGAENAVEVTGWPQYSQEALIATPPDIVLYPRKSVTREQIEKLFAVSPAIEAGVQMVAVDENVFTRPGPRVASAAARLNAIIDEWEHARH